MLKMKRIIPILIVSGLIALPVSIAAAGSNDASEKELCILILRDCADKVYHLQEKIRKIQDELARGATVYNAEEIKKLKDKLKEAEDMTYGLTPSMPSQKETK
jgi:hypothetical protein